MNKERRTTLESIKEHLGEVRDKLGKLAEAEQDALDEIPDCGTEEYQKTEAAAEGLEDVLDTFDQLLKGIEEVLEL